MLADLPRRLGVGDEKPLREETLTPAEAFARHGVATPAELYARQKTKGSAAWAGKRAAETTSRSAA